MEKNRTQFPFTTALRSNKLTSHDHNNKNKHYDRPNQDRKKQTGAEKKIQFGICSNRLDFCCFIVGVGVGV